MVHAAEPVTSEPSSPAHAGRGNRPRGGRTPRRRSGPRGALPRRGARRAEARAAALGLRPVSMGGGGLHAGRADRDVRGARRALRLHGDDLRHASDRGGVPGAARRGQPVVPGLPPAARGLAAAHRLGDLRGRRGRRACGPRSAPSSGSTSASASPRTRPPSPTASRPTTLLDHRPRRRRLGPGRPGPAPPPEGGLPAQAPRHLGRARDARDLLGGRAGGGRRFGGADPRHARSRKSPPRPWSRSRICSGARCGAGSPPSAVRRAAAWVRAEARKTPGTTPPSGAAPGRGARRAPGDARLGLRHRQRVPGASRRPAVDRASCRGWASPSGSTTSRSTPRGR